MNHGYNSLIFFWEGPTVSENLFLRRLPMIQEIGMWKFEAQSSPEVQPKSRLSNTCVNEPMMAQLDRQEALGEGKTGGAKREIALVSLHC